LYKQLFNVDNLIFLRLKKYKGDSLAVWHGEKGKKKTGGLIRLARKKRKFELGNLPVLTKVDEPKRRVVRTKGGGLKVKLVSETFVNVSMKGKTKKTKILEVVKNPSNVHFAKRGIITKGTIVKTELGLVKITSRPGQNGVLNGVLIEKV
jgi:small subunit ribosomal protein S8e